MGLSVLKTVNPAERMFREAGNLDGYEVFNNQVLVGTYVGHPTMMLGGKEFHLSDHTRKESGFQSKIGMILKMGPNAFQDENGKWFKGVTFEVGDWIVYRASDGWALKLQSDNPEGCLCRLIDDISVRMRIPASEIDRVY